MVYAAPNTFATQQQIEIPIITLNGLGNSGLSEFRVLQPHVDSICLSSIQRWRAEINNVDNVGGAHTVHFDQSETTFQVRNLNTWSGPSGFPSRP